MKTVNIHEAKTHLSRLIKAAMGGEEIVIAKAGKPMVRIVPISSQENPRPLGLLAGMVRESEGAWDADAHGLHFATRDESLKVYGVPLLPV